MDCQSSIWFIHLFRDHDGWFAGRAAAAKVEELGLSRGNPRIQFAQLKGMADVLSLSLVHAGFRVSKVLAFGSVPEFIPFIVRRAEENRGLLGNTAIDRQCLRCDYILFPTFEKLVLFCFNSHNSWVILVFTLDIHIGVTRSSSLLSFLTLWCIEFRMELTRRLQKSFTL